MATRGHLSPVVIAILALLTEEPMHAYRMQQLIKERGVDMVVNVRTRSGLHAAIERLVRDRLIRLRTVERDARYPERTVYELTSHGKTALLTGLRNSVATPSPEFPLFPAVVSFLHLLDPHDAQRQLEIRVEALQQRLTATQTIIANSIEYGVARVHLLEHEYIETVTAAELTWTRAVSRDIATDTLNW